jgi:glycogen(starch) synthase
MVSPEYPPRSIGGGGVVYKNLSEQLNRQGHRINVIAGNFENKNWLGKIEMLSNKNLHLSFVPLLPYPGLKNANLATYTLPTLSGLLFITKSLVKNKNSVVHLHGLCHPIIDVAAFMCLLLRRKYILTCHGIPVNIRRLNPLAKVFFSLYLGTIERLIVKNAAVLTTVSNALKNKCINKKLTNKKMIVVPNGVNAFTHSFTPQIVERIEAKYSLCGKHVIFAIGRLSENKGFQHLIEAMPHVVSVMPNAVAVIAGTGAYKEKLVELIKSNGLEAHVKLVGWVSEEDKLALYARSDMVVFPSVDEPFGIVLLEALEMNKPLIAFNTPSAKEILNDEVAIFIPVGNSDALAKAIVEVINDSKLRRKLVINTTKISITSWDKIVNKYIAVYQNLIPKSWKLRC